MKHHLKTAVHDIVIPLLCIAVLLLPLASSLNYGECEAEVSPMICIPMYKILD